MNRGYYGASFPFRIGSKGGIVMSGTSYSEYTHIEEAIQQILGTRLGERCMECNEGSSLSVAVFDSQDEALTTIIEYEIKEVLREKEPRIDVIQVEVSEGDNGKVEAHIVYRVVNSGAVSDTNVTIGGGLIE